MGVLSDWDSSTQQKPLNDSSGVFTISEYGNLVVLNGQADVKIVKVIETDTAAHWTAKHSSRDSCSSRKFSLLPSVKNSTAEVLWSSNVSNSLTNSSATLLDSGNLVLQVDTKGKIWESFQHPSDSFLPGMKISTNFRKNQRVQLTARKSPSDPSIGSFSSGIDKQNTPGAFIWKDGRPYWRTGPWNGQAFIGIYNTNPQYHNGYTVVDDKEGTVFATFAYVNELPLSKFVLDSQGKLVQTYWNNGKEDWEVLGIAPKYECEVYGTCGPFGTCHSLGSPICSCLRGFEPKIIEEWNRGNWTSGCVRRTALQCERVNNSGEEGKADGFFKLKMIKVPDFAERSYGAKDNCRKQCLENCSCVAYAYDAGIGCLSWSGNLIDLQKFSSGGSDIYIYIGLAYLEFANAIKVEEKVVKLYNRECPFDDEEGGGRGMWGSINLEHPATFNTLAMDPEHKKAIINDLDRFLRRKEFYKKVGKAWKRGYLLYGPPGTGKSSLVAAMANYLKFDIYDLELTTLPKEEVEDWAVTAWSIWNARNRFVHEDCQIPPQTIRANALAIRSEFNQARLSFQH
uniref:non-specific serine/threonine protein kinase n=1 Tax=Fagus sylvatica TaxID=28930 RepID=A0A2N9ERP4_FAGSY